MFGGRKGPGEKKKVMSGSGVATSWEKARCDRLGREGENNGEGEKSNQTYRDSLSREKLRGVKFGESL